MQTHLKEHARACAPKPQTRTLNKLTSRALLQHLAVGGLARGIAVGTLFPIDSIKTRVQVSWLCSRSTQICVLARARMRAPALSLSAIMYGRTDACTHVHVHAYGHTQTLYHKSFFARICPRLNTSNRLTNPDRTKSVTVPVKYRRAFQRIQVRMCLQIRESVSLCTCGCSHARAMRLQECVVVLGWCLLNPKPTNLNLNSRNTEEEH